MYHAPPYIEPNIWVRFILVTSTFVYHKQTSRQGLKKNTSFLIHHINNRGNYIIELLIISHKILASDTNVRVLVWHCRPVCGPIHIIL